MNIAFKTSRLPLALLCVTFLSGCSQKAPDSTSKRYKIGFANLTETMPFTVRVRENLEKAAKEAGNVDLVMADNKLDGATALANADNFVTQGVQGVIEFSADEKFGKPIMQKFKSKNIPVIAIDVPMPGATYFGINNPVAGRMAGKGLGEWVKKNWGGKIDALIMLELPEAGEVLITRLNSQREGLESVIGKIPESKVKHLNSKGAQDVARTLVTDVLTTLPNAKKIAVVSGNDDTAAGAITAAESTGRKSHLAVVAVDGSDFGLKNIRKPGSPHIGSTASFPEKYGEKILPMMIKAIDGEEIPGKFYTDHVFITRDNIDKYYPNVGK